MVAKFCNCHMLTAIEVDSSPFRNKQMNHLLSLLNFNLSPTSIVETLAQIGQDSQTLSTQNQFSPSIIDLGAFEYMTNFSNIFISYFPISCFENIKIVNGSYSSIYDKGSIKNLEQNTLQFVLHVLKSHTYSVTNKSTT